MQTVQAILTFLQAHLLLSSSVSGWFLASTIVNIALAWKGPQWWIAYAEKNPKVAVVVNVLVRSFGIDLVSVILHIQAYLNARAAATKKPAAAAPPAETPKEEKK